MAEGMARVVRLRTDDVDPFDFSATPLPRFIVYVVRCGDFVKIGTTQNLRRRLKALKAGNPYPISLIATFEGTDLDERALHARLAAHRHHYEWFRLEGAVVEFIAGLTKAVVSGDG